MKIYKGRITHPEEGTVVVWDTSHHKCWSRALKMEHDLRRDGDDPAPIEIMAEEIDTRRAGLVDWLNVHFTRHNG